MMVKSIFGLLILAISSTYAQRWSWNPAAVPLKGAVNLRCTASEDIDVYHNGVKIANAAPYSLTKTTASGTTTLNMKIEPVNEPQAGDYKCRAASDATKESITQVQIRVSGPDDKKTYNKAIGSKATVEFYVVGIPRPEIQYFTKAASGGQGELLVTLSDTGTLTKGANGARYSITTDKGYLVIDNVEQVDGREYIVVATSLGVPHTFSLTLNVGAPPKITTSPKKAYNMTTGVAATIPCAFETAPTTVKWIVTTKAGVKSDVTAATSGNIKLDGTNLNIVSPTRANEGDSYECYGENTFGTATAKTMVNVVYEKPVISALSSPVKVVEGASETLTCKATGNPKPVVQWSFKSGATYSVVSGQKMLAGESSYTIAKADASHAGEYKCDAFLEGKKDLNDAKMLTVELLTMPMIDAAKTSVSKQYPVGKNESQDLMCGASGSPLPAVMFMKGDKELTGAVEVSKDAKSIVMKLAYIADKLSDAGVVTCMAKSSVGNVTKDIRIEMIDVPKAPTGLKAEETENNYVVLTWNSVAGASEYKVFADGNEKMKSPAPRAKVEKLDGGKTYAFSVSAKNLAGFGAASAPLSVTTLKFGKPSVPRPDAKGAPTTFTGTVASFNWEAPVSDGGDKDLKYVVRYCPQDSSGSYPPADCKEVPTNTTSVMIKGLKENTMYHFKVQAKNQRGTGDAMEFAAKTGASKAPPPTNGGPTKKTPKHEKKKGLGGGAIAGIIIAVILILLIVIDLFCCFFNECGFTHCCYQACCAGKGKGKYAAADSKDPEKHELHEQENDQPQEPEVKTSEENKEKEEKEAPKEKKTEDV